MRIAGILGSLTMLSLLCGADLDPVLGKWRLNFAKSHTPGAAPKSAVRTYRTSSAGVRVKETWIAPEGRRISLDYTARYDGKD